jgi:hypothetical protein
VASIFGPTTMFLESLVPFRVLGGESFVKRFSKFVFEERRFVTNVTLCFQVFTKFDLSSGISGSQFIPPIPSFLPFLRLQRV